MSFVFDNYFGIRSSFWCDWDSFFFNEFVLCISCKNKILMIFFIVFLFLSKSKLLNFITNVGNKSKYRICFFFKFKKTNKHWIGCQISFEEKTIIFTRNITHKIISKKH